MRELSRTEIGNELIDPELKAFLLAELTTLPGARIIKRKGQLFLRSGNGCEILCQRLFAMRSRWVELVNNPPI